MSGSPPIPDHKATAAESPNPIAAPAIEQDTTATSAPSLHPPSATHHNKGHAPKPSVGIAASLFGSSGDDDPFSSIAASHSTPFLSQLAETAEEEPDLFGASSPAGAHTSTGATAAAADHATSPFGGEPASSDPVLPSVGAVSEALLPPTERLEVPIGEGKVGSPASGPASPGALFADSSYQDDWLGAGGPDQTHHTATAGANRSETAQQGADPFAAADGGQGSLSWLNQEAPQPSNAGEPQYNDFGQPIASTESESTGYGQEYYGQQQHPEAYGVEHQEQGYGYVQQQQQGYDYQPQGYDQYQQGYDQYQQGYDQYQQGYDYQQQGYDQQVYAQQNHEQHAYDQGAYDTYTRAEQDYIQPNYDQHQAYAQSNEAPQSFDHTGQEQQTFASYDPYAPPLAPELGDVAAPGYDHNNSQQIDSPYDPTAGHAQAPREQNGTTSYVQDATSYSVHHSHTYAPDTNAEQQHGNSDPYAHQQGQTPDPYHSQQPHAPQQEWSDQSYGHGAEGLQSLTPGYDADTYGETRGAAAEPRNHLSMRAPNPYDAPATAPLATSPGSDNANRYAPSSSASQVAGLPPPPKGPPRGPPRGPSRSSSRNAHSINETASPGALDISTRLGSNSAAVSLEEESLEQSAPVWPNEAETSRQAPQQQPDVADTSFTTYKHTASAWVDSLEQAAATPPASNGDEDSLPILTVTDESGNGYGGTDETLSQTGTELQHSRDNMYGSEPHDAVDDVITTFDLLNLDQNQQTQQDQFNHTGDYENGYSVEEGRDDETIPEGPNQRGLYPERLGSGRNGLSDLERAPVGSDWNGYGPKNGQTPPAATTSDALGPYDTQHELSTSAKPPQTYDLYNVEAKGPDGNTYAPTGSPNGHAEEDTLTFTADATGEEESEARTPLASHGEKGWLEQSSAFYKEDIADDAYRPAAVSENAYVPRLDAGFVSYSSYDPYGHPSAENQSADSYAADSNHAHPQSQRNLAPGIEEEVFASNGRDHEQPDQQRVASPHQYAYDRTYGTPAASLYEPHDYSSSATGMGQNLQAAASDTRSSTVSEASTDMLQTMRSAIIPIASFGIGGKLVSYFPTSQGSSDAANSAAHAGNVYAAYSYNASSYPTAVKIQALSSLVPSTAYASAFDPLTFPGPVFEGAGGTNALSRATGAASATKSKKAALIKHLDERVEELSAGVGYLRRRPSFSGSAMGSNQGAADQDSELEARRTEDKVLLLRLLKLLVENDGQTSSAAFEQGVRSLIMASNSSDPASPDGLAISVTLTMQSDGAEGSVVTSHELRTGFLQKVQGMLLRGERRQAVEYAVAQKMWAHAMTIASCVDKECWKEVVSEFIEHEVGAAETALTGQGQGDLQGLKVAYNVFSGQDPVSIFDLFRVKTQLGQMGGLQRATVETMAPSTALPSWKASAAIVASNRSPSDSAALTAIGDGLCTRGLLEAAHFCYLLSPQTSPIGGADTTGSRFTLLGLANPKASTAFVNDLDGILMTEVLEFAQGLVPTVKGQEPFPGIPHLQAYKLVHAQQLAELGEVGKAQRYCEAIAQCLKQCKHSPYLHSTLLSQSKQLSDRLVGAPQSGPGGNWMTRKMQRPTLDGVWGALEGRFTKFIAGEDGAGDADSPNKNSKGLVSSSVGPFSHYSAITPDAASGGMTRQQSYNELRTGSPSVPASRSGSAMDFRSGTRPATSPKHRASSALSMRPLSSDPYNDWPQPRTSGNESASNYDGDSIGSTSEIPRYAQGYGDSLHVSSSHGAQASEFSVASSTYGGRADTSFTSDAAPWHSDAGRGGRDTESSSRPSTDVLGPSGGSEAGANSVGDYGGYASGYGGHIGYGQGPQIEKSPTEEQDDTSGQVGAGQTPFYGYDPHGAQRPQFVSNIDATGALEFGDEGGFISPFDALSSNSRTPQPQSQNNEYAPSYGQSRADEEEEDDDDLGLGNSSSRRKASVAGGQNDGSSDASDASPRNSVASSSAANTSKQSTADSKKDDAASNASGTSEKRQELKSSPSWFGRLWGRSSSTDGAAQTAQAKAKKAHLGEETSFVYDKELKRWVNKKAGDSGSAVNTPPPPPPARTQSASPASQPDRSAGASSAPPMRAPPSGGFSIGRATPPISEDHDEGSSGLAPSRGPPGMGSLTRARSNLADHSMPPASQPPMSARSASGTSTPAGVGSPPPPPPGGSRTGTVKKRPIKSRYVVVD